MLKHPSGRPIDQKPRPKDRPAQMHDEFRLPRLRPQKELKTEAVGFIHSFVMDDKD